MKVLIKKYFDSEFSKNVLTMVTGTSVAQLVPFLAAPILSRIYTPEEFGLLALYLTIAQVLGAVANGRYELAIILPKDDLDAVKLVLLSLLISCCLSLIVLIGVIVGGEYISAILRDKKLTNWLYLLPVSVFMIGLFNALSYYHIRNKKFGDVAKARVLKSFSGTGVQLAIGLFGLLNSGGLILGQVSSHIGGNIQMVRTLTKNIQQVRNTKWEEFKSLAIRYQDFPKYSSWGIFINTISHNFPNVFIARYFRIVDVGFYSHAYKYLGLPLNLIGNAIGQVFIQNLSEVKDDIKMSKKLFLKTLQKLFFIGLLMFIPAYFLIENLYELIFGKDWIVAGTYSKLMLPLFFCRLLTSPLSNVSMVFERQRSGLLINIFLFLVMLFSMILSLYLKFSVKYFVISLSISLSVFYLLLLIAYYRMIGRRSTIVNNI
ncbi:oligosaccharide flippase family protein [Ekhidna sp. MALMAid0563]|uniref:oligosaccharide flippase family protein n=1 Tax=Ekhidna sp. MALMAid0563 TaxID=3143937 RepID=UPI0032DEF8DF